MGNKRTASPNEGLAARNTRVSSQDSGTRSAGYYSLPKGTLRASKRSIPSEGVNCSTRRPALKNSRSSWRDRHCCVRGGPGAEPIFCRCVQSLVVGSTGTSSIRVTACSGAFSSPQSVMVVNLGCTKGAAALAASARSRRQLPSLHERPCAQLRRPDERQIRWPARCSSNREVTCSGIWSAAWWPPPSSTANR